MDCQDVTVVASFWAGLLGAAPTEPIPGWRRIGPFSPGGPVLNFQPVAEAKLGKARLHLDLRVDDLVVAAAAIKNAGGRDLQERHEYDDGNGTVLVMADPEGNEFCIVQYG